MEGRPGGSRHRWLFVALPIAAAAVVLIAADVAAVVAAVVAVVTCCVLVATAPRPSAVASAVAAATVAVCFVAGESLRHRLGATDVRLDGSPGMTVVLYVWTAAAPLVMAAAIRSRRARTRDAARLRQLALDRALADQRLGLARELHDVVAHHIGGIAVLAQGAGTDPAKAAGALPVIARESRLALDELRTVLDTLRGPAEEPSASDLRELIERMNAAGARITLRTEDNRAPLAGPGGAERSRALDRAVFRIVQEAVTNVLRHAQPPTGVVTVRRNREQVYVIVDDDGRQPRPAGGPASRGHGLDGMRERAAALGGMLTAGPRPGHGWRVHAVLPVTDPASRPAGDGAPEAAPA